MLYELRWRQGPLKSNFKVLQEKDMIKKEKCHHLPEQYWIYEESKYNNT